MSRSALARGTRTFPGALLLLGAACAVPSCSLWPGQSDVPRPSSKPSSPQAAAGTGGMGGALVERADKPKPTPIRRGSRGTGCSVKNDCESGLSCVRGLCEPASFGLSPSGKECVQIDCADTADCCGGLPSEIPEKCRSRAAACTKTLPGCEAKACTRS